MQKVGLLFSCCVLFLISAIRRWRINVVVGVSVLPLLQDCVRKLAQQRKVMTSRTFSPPVLDGVDNLSVSGPESRLRYLVWGTPVRV